MVAANITSKDKNLDQSNVFRVDEELGLLKSAAIYGANASGKSNLTKALGFMAWFTVNSSKETQSTEKISVESFRLSTETENEPSFFELAFLMDKRKYRYGFEVTRERVISEWLYYVPKSRETKLFERYENEIVPSKKMKSDGIQQKTRHNALFLSVCAQFNVEIAEKILYWFNKKLNIISGLDDRLYRDYTLNCLLEGRDRDEIIKLIRKLDLGIKEFEVAEKKFSSEILPEGMPDEFKKLIMGLGKNGKIRSVTTAHPKFDSSGNQISLELFELGEQESEGTQKIFAMSGLLVDTLKEGNVLIIDEFDARLHPIISQAIVQLFNSKKANPKNAQLILITHDTNLLNNAIFRRDQIWFAEKNTYGATDLYSLVEYKVRNDASFETNYIKGRYGAIPFIGDLHQLMGVSHE